MFNTLAFLTLYFAAAVGLDRYTALLYTSDWLAYWQSCGGTILNNRSILTSALCLHGDAVGRWRVRVGSTWANSGGLIHNVNQHIIHSNFNATTIDNDVAILRTTTLISFVVNFVYPGSIAGSNYNLTDNQIVWAAGWGRISELGPSSEQLRHVQVLTVNQTVCRTRYAVINRVITDNMLCSGVEYGGRDQCYGDSGGPLYHNGVVVGISSWGYGCARPLFPHINARVSRYATWILSNS